MDDFVIPTLTQFERAFQEQIRKELEEETERLIIFGETEVKPVPNGDGHISGEVPFVIYIYGERHVIGHATIEDNKIVGEFDFSGHGEVVIDAIRKGTFSSFSIVPDIQPVVPALQSTPWSRLVK